MSAAPQGINKATERVAQVSNELEFSLHGVDAGRLIRTGNGELNIMHEVNMRDVVELNVSMKSNVNELNDALVDSVRKLIALGSSLGGFVYGGASLLRDVEGMEPKRYRTTSLSETLAKGLMDITSQQVVIGVSDERLGFDIYNFFGKISPALVAISASSPYGVRGENLKDTGSLSRRMNQYERSCARLPSEMWMAMPELQSMSDHRTFMRSVSESVHSELRKGMLDCNWNELSRVRNNGNGDFSYYPFGVLEPNQVYTFVRLRPDHRNVENGGSSVFSVELRAPDMPTTLQRMQMMNSLVLGLAYNIAVNGESADSPLTDPMINSLTGSFENLKTAARDGLHARIEGRNGSIHQVMMEQLIERLVDYADIGLSASGHAEESARMGRMIGKIMRTGNDADLIRQHGFKSSDELRDYLRVRIAEGESE